jgi:macrophage erythroblast attacher
MKTARALASAQRIDSLVDIKLFAELVRIETALVEKHSCTEALAWCGENRGTLKKQGSDLEFVLRLQEFIELCRKRDTSGAIAYARKNLAPWASTHMAEVQQGMTLLAFGETTGVQTYRKLYDRARWASVRDRFRDTFLTLYALPSQALLALSLSAGLSSLRLPACTGTPAPPPAAPRATTVPAPLLPQVPDLHAVLGRDSLVVPDSNPRASSPGAAAAPDPASRNVDCPTCDPDLGRLAREVPLAHHVNSTLVCRISGAVMDSENEPMAFPKGHVYSSKALKEMARNNFDIVTCPVTHESCSFARLRKVYIS